MNLDVFLKLFAVACKAVRWLTLRKPNKGVFLIVEDNLHDARNLENKIKKAGWQCEHVTSGEAARGMVKHSHYPCIFVDLRLPGMPGEALLRVLSEDAPNSNTVIVCGNPDDLSDLEPGQMRMHIIKPVSLEAIEDMLKKLKL